MQYKNIIITSKRKIGVRNNQFVIGDQEQEIAFPLEDVNSIVIDNPEIQLSARFLSLLSDNRIVLYITDDKHLPNAVFLPMLQHSRHFQMLKYQMNASKPLLKRLWKSIVIQKIENQARCLELLQIDGANQLYRMCKEVKSGDTGNVESKAAAFYFKRIFGNGFARDDSCWINSALNYGYAIFRGMIARSIVSYGFEPSIGIWHKSELNAFNLADDIIEPFRPVVDLYVASFVNEKSSDNLSSLDKRNILNLIN